jgi:hypothetical protein
MITHFHNNNSILAFRGFNELHEFNLILMVSSHFILKICKHILKILRSLCNLSIGLVSNFDQYRHWVGIGLVPS